LVRFQPDHFSSVCYTNIVITLESNLQPPDQPSLHALCALLHMMPMQMVSAVQPEHFKSHGYGPERVRESCSITLLSGRVTTKYRGYQPHSQAVGESSRMAWE